MNVDKLITDSLDDPAQIADIVIKAKAKQVIDRLIGEADEQPQPGQASTGGSLVYNDHLIRVTRKLCGILNSYMGSNLEDESPYPGVKNYDDDDAAEQHADFADANPDWAKNPEYDTSGEPDDLASFRRDIFQWIDESKELFAGNDQVHVALDQVGHSVRHHMRHETEDCLYNIGETWAKFLRKNEKGPQILMRDSGFVLGAPTKYSTQTNSMLHDILSGNPLDNPLDDFPLQNPLDDF